MPTPDKQNMQQDDPKFPRPPGMTDEEYAKARAANRDLATGIVEKAYARLMDGSATCCGDDPKPPPDNEGELDKALADARHESDELEKNMAELERSAQANQETEKGFVTHTPDMRCKKCMGRGFYYQSAPDGSVNIPEQKTACDCGKKLHEHLRGMTDAERALEESRQRQRANATARLKKNTSCIPHVDPDTFQMDWRLMMDGSEIIRFDTNAMAVIRKNYPTADLPPELLALINWFTKLGKERLAVKDEVFAGGAKMVAKAQNYNPRLAVKKAEA